ncbi:hypothetical protein GCM10009527_072280 [Actinomadura nitritigenes]
MPPRSIQNSQPEKRGEAGPLGEAPAASSREGGSCPSSRAMLHVYHPTAERKEAAQVTARRATGAPCGFGPARLDTTAAKGGGK